MATCRLSVVIASYNSRCTVESCIRSLERQTDPTSFEIIVVDSSSDGTGEFVERNFPHVRISCLSERKFCGDARNIGIAMARGEVVAFIDADCIPKPTWVEEILKAHGSQYVAIGGAIANGNPESYVGWAAYFTEFSKWMPGKKAGWLTDIAGANMSYKREVFERYGDFLEGTYSSDTEFHWRLCKDGLRLRFVPAIVVYHLNIEDLRTFLQHEILHGRSFAQVRVISQRFSWRKRAIYIVCTPFIVAKLLCEIGLESLHSRQYFWRFVRTLPLLVLGVCAWCLGEAIGYAGTG